MTTMLKLSALAAATLATATFASATNITLNVGSYGNGSSGSGFSNTQTVYSPFSTLTPPFSFLNTTAYALDPGTVWHAPLAAGNGQSSWVGKNPTDGPGTVNGNHEPNGTYTYFSTFNQTNFTSQAFGILSVLADDTMNVWLNGHQIFSASDSAFNHTCNDSTPNCTMVATADLLASDFVNGTNVLRFDVIQSAGYNTGLDFAGTINTTPEPSSLLLLGTGLVGSAGALLRRMRA